MMMRSQRWMLAALILGAGCGDDKSTSLDAGADAAGPLCPGLDESIDIDANGTPDCVENLLVNAQFATNLDSWAASDEAVTLERDATGDGTAAGAIRVTSATMTNSPSFEGAAQCIAISPSTRYFVGGRFFIPSGQTESLGIGAVVDVYMFASTDCSGEPGPADRTNIDMTTIGAWGTVTGMPNSNASERSALIVATVRKSADSAGDPAVVVFDNLLVRPVP